MTQEAMFRGQKSFPLKSPLTGSVNIDISLIEHITVTNNQHIEIICMNVDSSVELNRTYITSKTINDLINQEELEKHENVRNSTDKIKTEYSPLSSASMRSVTIQKLLDLLTLNSSVAGSFMMELSPFNTIQLSIPIPGDLIPYALVSRCDIILTTAITAIGFLFFSRSCCLHYWFLLRYY